MKTFFLFLKSYAVCGIYMVLCFGFISTIFLLCHLPWAPVLYALGLCIVLGTIFLSIAYFQFYQKHRLLTGLQLEIGDTIDHLPQASGQIEKDYQELLSKLFTLKTGLALSTYKNQQDTMEYYTMWVHQIKTPIAAMKLILQENDSPENAELRAELFKIQQYVEMVLCYLRLDGSTSDFVFRMCSLDHILRQAVHTYAGQFIRKKIRLVYRPVTLQVLTDEKWLQFVIEQLLSNALKYTSSGSVTITIDSDGCLVIRDTGIGIAQEDLPRILERGYTGLNGRSGQRSTGIGLYLCNRILKKLGHKISFRSRPGRGTEVILDLKHRYLEFD